MEDETRARELREEYEVKRAGGRKRSKGRIKRVSREQTWYRTSSWSGMLLRFTGTDR